MALAAALGVLAPGISPLTAGSVPPAWAKPRDPWMPPSPSSAGKPADGGGKPDQEYVRDTECVISGQEVRKDLILKNKPWGQMHLRLDEVHRYVASKHGTIGGGITVAVIDTGVTPHPLLAGRLKSGGDYVDAGGNGLEDCDGHGTQVAGIIAAKVADTSAGFRGVAPDARILSIRQSSQVYHAKTEQQKESEQREAKDKAKLEQLQKEREELEERARQAEEEAERRNQEEDSGGGSGTAGVTAPGQDGGPRVQESKEAAGNLRTLAQAVVRAVDLGAKVINMSVDSCRLGSGSAREPLTDKEKMLQSAVHYAVERDVVVVAAAGNTSDVCQQNNQANPNRPTTLVTPPWFSEDLLAVAAIDKTGGVAPFSMHGPWVSVAAPGTEIISLDPAKGSNQLANLTIEGGKSTPIQGTSFAAPYVAGLAALVRQMYPKLSARQVMERITATAQHPATRDGHNSYVGHGVINPMAALTADVPTERGIAPAEDIALPSDMPPPNPPDRTPVVVALAGSAGAAAALGLTFFAVHTIRRRRPDYVSEPRGVA